MFKKISPIALILAAITISAVSVGSYAAKEKSPVDYSVKIAVVSIRDVFENSPAKAEAEKVLAAEGEAKFNELKKLEAEIEADRAALEKRKQDSTDYLEMLKAIMLKQSTLDAQKEFYQQEMSIKEMQKKEKIYRKILEVVGQVAQQKEIDVVLSRDDNYLNDPNGSVPAQNPTELVLTIKTHKLFYFNPKLDITADVQAAMANAKLD